jgi:hypothetical protein
MENKTDLDDSMYGKIKKIFNLYDYDDEIKEKVKPAGKISSYVTRIQLLNPMGIYRRGYKLSLDTREENDVKEKYVLADEKRFLKRLGFILLIMALQSISFSFAITASISLPWTFNIVIPFTLDFLPFNLKEIIEAFILFIQNLLKPLDPIIAIIEEIIKFISSFNPALLFVGTFWLFDSLGWIDADKYLNIPDDYTGPYTNGTSMDILAYNLEQKYPALGDLVVPFILLMFSIMSFFFLITKAKKILFELVNERKFSKHKKKMRKKILAYYMNQGAVEFEYTKKRSPRIKAIKKFYWSMMLLGIIMAFSPVVLALVVIFL